MSQSTQSLRSVAELFNAKPASDGAGVKLSRLIGGSAISDPNGGALDPFLMLDEFNTDKADDYIAGFPSHPHRGFETVTYMLEGNMEHKDHLGNTGLLQSGDVQWMTAARGIIHSEMPQQVDGKMQGFQLWLNLPATEKMKDPAYRDIKSQEIPLIESEGFQIKVIAGDIKLANNEYQGAIRGASTQPLYLDLNLAEHGSVAIPTAHDHTALVYVYDGTLTVESDNGNTLVQQKQMVKLSPGDQIKLTAQHETARALILAAKPLKEPVVQWGPFVMNSREEVEQAMADYRSGMLTQPLAS